MYAHELEFRIKMPAWAPVEGDIDTHVLTCSPDTSVIVHPALDDHQLSCPERSSDVENRPCKTPEPTSAGRLRLGDIDLKLP